MYIETKIKGFSKVYSEKDICPIFVAKGTQVSSADTHQTSQHISNSAGYTKIYDDLKCTLIGFYGYNLEGRKQGQDP